MMPNQKLPLALALRTSAAAGLWFVRQVYQTHCRPSGGFFVL